MSELIKNGQDYIWNEYKPAFSNTYEVNITGSGNLAEKLHKYKFLAKSINLMGESIALSRDGFTKAFKLASSDAYKRIDTVSITWSETSWWGIKQLHDDWLSLFYDKENDCFISVPIDEDPKNRYLTFEICIYPDWSYKKTNDGYLKVKLIDCIPTKSGDINLVWTSSPSIINHTIPYYPTKVEFVVETGIN